MRSPHTPRAAAVLAVLSGLVLLAGCGGSSSNGYSSPPATTPPTTPPATTSSTAPAGHGLALSASPDGSLMFDKTSLTTTAGHVTITFTNTASLGHNLTVASASGAVVGATPTFSGGSRTLSLDLTAGKYTFYCSVPGHEAAGMQGTLTVTS